MAPGVGPAVVRVGKTAQPRLVAVVDGRGTGPGHLEQYSLAHDLHVDIGHGRFSSQIMGAADDAVGAGQKARVVVVGEFIHADAQSCIGHGILVHVQDRPPEGVGITVVLLSLGVAVFLHAGEEECDGLHEKLVVHDGVPFFALQPVLGVSVVLGQNDGVRVCLFDSLAEALPEVVVKLRGIAEVGCDIQSPAIGIVGR